MRKTFLLISVAFFTILGCKKEKDTTPQKEQSQLPIELITTPDSLSFTEIQRIKSFHVSRSGNVGILLWEITSLPMLNWWRVLHPNP